MGLVGSQRRSGPGREGKNPFHAPVGNRTSVAQSVSQSLYWLRSSYLRVSACPYDWLWVSVIRTPVKYCNICTIDWLRQRYNLCLCSGVSLSFISCDHNGFVPKYGGGGRKSTNYRRMHSETLCTVTQTWLIPNPRNLKQFILSEYKFWI